MVIGTCLAGSFGCFFFFFPLDNSSSLSVGSRSVNFSSCVCGHEFCIICAGPWIPLDPNDPEAYCHNGDRDAEKHELKIPPEVERLLEEERQRVIQRVSVPNLALVTGCSPRQQ